MSGKRLQFEEHVIIVDGPTCTPDELAVSVERLAARGPVQTKHGDGCRCIGCWSEHCERLVGQEASEQTPDARSLFLTICSEDATPAARLAAAQAMLETVERLDAEVLRLAARAARAAKLEPVAEAGRAFLDGLHLGSWSDKHHALNDALTAADADHEPCPGIELDDGAYSGCGGGLDCPTCCGGIDEKYRPAVRALFDRANEAGALGAELDALRDAAQAYLENFGRIFTCDTCGDIGTRFSLEQGVACDEHGAGPPWQDCDEAPLLRLLNLKPAEEGDDQGEVPTTGRAMTGSRIRPTTTRRLAPAAPRRGRQAARCAWGRWRSEGHRVGRPGDRPLHQGPTRHRRVRRGRPRHGGRRPAGDAAIPRGLPRPSAHRGEAVAGCDARRPG
jgi:hypothetical protein